MAKGAVQLPPAQGAAFVEQLQDTVLEWGETVSYREDRGAFLVQRIGLLGETGRDHRIDAGCQWRQGGFSQLTRQPDLLRGEDCQWVKQGSHRFGLGYLGLIDKAEHHPLHLLPSERHFNQMTRSYHVLQLRRQSGSERCRSPAAH